MRAKRQTALPLLVAVYHASKGGSTTIAGPEQVRRDAGRWLLTGFFCVKKRVVASGIKRESKDGLQFLGILPIVNLAAIGGQHLRERMQEYLLPNI
jgi:hypothetical protein